MRVTGLGLLWQSWTNFTASLHHFNSARVKAMILSETEMGQILEQLLRSTTKKELDWYRENDRLIVSLPNQTTIELAADVKGPDVVIEVKGCPA